MCETNEYLVTVAITHYVDSDSIWALVTWTDPSGQSSYEDSFAIPWTGRRGEAGVQRVYSCVARLVRRVRIDAAGRAVRCGGSGGAG